TAGGAVTINSYTANLASGSTIDVSGGVAVSPLGTRTYGNGGSIVINAGQDPSLPQVLGGHLMLEVTLKGYSGAAGGSLNIRAPLIQIGGSASHPDPLLLSPDFFSQGGFTNFSLTGIGAPTSTDDEYLPAVVIAPNTVIEPVAESLLAIPYSWGSDTVVMQR